MRVGVVARCDRASDVNAGGHIDGGGGLTSKLAKERDVAFYTVGNDGNVT